MSKTELKVVGTIQKVGLEGGLLALITEAGESYELLGAASDLKPGLRIEAVLETRGADASIGMIGRSARVKSFRVLP